MGRRERAMSTMEHLPSRVLVTAFAIGVIVLRKTLPDLLDTTDLILIGLALLPWLTHIIKSAELPGGIKVEFHDLKAAVEKVTGGQLAEAPERPSYRDIADIDPNLALVKLRIEIEKRLRDLGRLHGLNDRQPLIRLFHQLRDEDVLVDPVLSGLQELVMFGNQAAHGAAVDKEAAEWSLQFGPRVLAVLDAVLSES